MCPAAPPMAVATMTNGPPQPNQPVAVATLTGGAAQPPVVVVGNLAAPLLSNMEVTPELLASASKLRCSCIALLIFSILQTPSIGGILGICAASGLLCCGGGDGIATALAQAGCVRGCAIASAIFAGITTLLSTAGLTMAIAATGWAANGGDVEYGWLCSSDDAFYPEDLYTEDDCVSSCTYGTCMYEENPNGPDVDSNTLAAALAAYSGALGYVVIISFCLLVTASVAAQRALNLQRVAAGQRESCCC